MLSLKPYYIDIHTHILPGLDDGSQDEETSLQMAEIAAGNGTKCLVCTKHTDMTESVSREDGRLIRDGVRWLREELQRERIPLQVLPGMEIMASEDIRWKIREELLFGLNDSRYFLVEFPFDAPEDYISFILDEIHTFDGLVPVIAHPERYYCVQERPERIYQWVMEGCLTQCNRASLEGKFGGREEITAQRLMDANLVTCIASDAHSSRQRTPRLEGGYRQIASRYGEWTADLLLRGHPERMIRNEPLEVRGYARPVAPFSME